MTCFLRVQITLQPNYCSFLKRVDTQIQRTQQVNDPLVSGECSEKDQSRKSRYLTTVKMTETVGLPIHFLFTLLSTFFCKYLLIWNMSKLF